jgi:hypothetical protein
MRFAIAPLAAALIPAVVGAETPVIDWNAARPLQWGDFLGAVPAHAGPERIAESNTSISWTYRYEVGWQQGACTFRITSIESAAGFHPDGSWVRPEHRTAAVLEHEQGHFDITRIYQQKFAAATRELVGISRDCGSGGRTRGTRSAEREIDRLAGSVYDAVWQEYREEQDAYDTETQHGIDSNAQSRWTNRIASLL